MSERLNQENQKHFGNEQTEFGHKMLREGHIGMACEHFRKVLALNPENIEAHRNLAVALRQSGDFESAVKHLERALDLKKRAELHSYRRSRVFYFCPDLVVKSGGVRRLYRHVDILVRNGFAAAILHAQKKFVLPDQPDVPIEYFQNPGVLKKNDIVVIPEGFPSLMLKLKDMPIRRFVIALSWSYVFSMLPDSVDWRHFNIERVLAVCPFICQMISWSMGLPTHAIDFAINPELYHYQPEKKKRQIAYIHNKAKDIDAFCRLLAARNPNYVRHFEWVALKHLNEVDYAARIRESEIFLNLSPAEGLLNSCFEAMAAGCIVAGFNSVGGQDMLVGEGTGQNCILAQNGDYVTLAYRMEPLLKDLLKGRGHLWQPIIQNGIRGVEHHTPASEEKSVIDFWNRFGRDPSHARNCDHISQR
ncbi:MAG: tetratricopeptide repeat protein [Deltaproteobacteria bacterium]|nr:tetratricopeptide repeat protein [Deltaproteobacteria bacterium]